MLIHVLTFANPERISPVTKVNLKLLKEAAADQGHVLKTIFASDCQLKFDKKPSLLIKNHEPKDINVLIVRANFLSGNIDSKLPIIKQFEVEGTAIINKSLPIARAKSKFRTMQVLSEAKIPIPKTYVVNHADYLDDVIDDIGSFPVILKKVTGSHGRGVSIIESKRGLKSVIEMIIQSVNDDPLIVQEYVKESTGKDIRVFILGKRIIGAMERIATKKGEFRSNFHLGGRVKVANMGKREKAVAFAAVETMGLQMAGVDILRTKNGPKVLEVNANPGLEGITEATGRDIAGEIIKYAVKLAKIA